MTSNISKTLDRKVWFPHIWFFLNTVAYTYPDTPTQVTKRKYYDFIQNIPLFIPNDEISNQFSHLLDAFPVTPYLANKDSFTYWIHFIHNKMNRFLGEEEKSYFEHMDEYYSHYSPTEYVLSTKWNIQKKYLVLAFIFICLLFCCYCYI
jgi:hypothetical protein